MTFATTHSGRAVNLARPHASRFLLADVARGLACTNRFNGQTNPGPYSVAQHSIVVAQIAATRATEPLLVLHALLHDAHEFILGDDTRPKQQALAAIDGGDALTRLQTRVQLAIEFSFGIPPITLDQALLVHDCDRVALATEWRDMMPTPVPAHFARPATFAIRPFPRWTQANDAFVATFERLHLAAGLRSINFNPVPTGISK